MESMRERLLSVARLRFENRPGAFDLFRNELSGTVQGIALAARAEQLPAGAQVADRNGVQGAREQLNAMLAALVDEWTASRLHGVERAPQADTSARATAGYVSLQEAANIVEQQTGIDITVAQLIRAGVLINLPLCVLLDEWCYSSTHRIRREEAAEKESPGHWKTTISSDLMEAGMTNAYGLFVLPPRHVFAFQMSDAVQIQYVFSLDGQDAYCPHVKRTRNDLQITTDALARFIEIVKAGQFSIATALESNNAATQRPKAAPDTAVSPTVAKITLPTAQRRDLLAPLIEAAKRERGNLSDAAEIWPVLVSYAKALRAPMIGMSDEGIKWENGSDGIEFFTLKNLRDRLDRQRKRTR